MARTKLPLRLDLVAKAQFETRGHQLVNASQAVALKRPMVRRYRPNVRVLQEIRQYQKSSDLLLPLRPFQRLVKGIVNQIPGNYCFQTTAVLALQEAAEAYLVGLYQDAQFCSLHRKHSTITPTDMKLAMRIRNVSSF